MPTYLFVTKSNFEPEQVSESSHSEWSCSKSTREGDLAFVYVGGAGVSYQWDITSDARPHKQWRYICGVKFVDHFFPPITLRELCAAIPKADWNPPHQNFRGFRSILIPDVIANQIKALRVSTSLAKAAKSASNEVATSDREILKAILYSPNRSASALQLQSLLDLTSIVQANAAIGRFGKKMFKILGSHPEGLKEGTFQWWTVAATGQPDEKLGFVWTLRNGIAEGLISAGYSDADLNFPDEMDPDRLLEGAFKRVSVNSFERNPVARSRCIQKYGSTCVVCGFDFGKIYGEEANGYIHVHHLTPLSELRSTYQVNPTTDLRPVCPNCHAVIHMTNPPKTIEQMKALMAVNRTAKSKPIN